MALYQFAPSPSLTEFVRVYRVVHFVFEDITNIPYKPYPPKPEHCLSFYPRDTETVQFANKGTKINNLKTVLIGQQSEVTNRFVGKDFLVFQVVFSPGGLFRLTGIPAQELNNCYIDAETIFGNALREVNDKLNDALNFTQMVQVVESFLWKQVNSGVKDFHRLDHVSNLILKSEKGLNIEWLANESCLSLRQYERKFIERMGISPRYFSKIARFENAFRIKNKEPHLDWLSIAMRCGYYDYQHLVKDYKEFTNQTPTGFHLLDSGSPERKFGESDTY
ncbi:helix-turn-helix domain-containing protein [Arcicella rosea]|uniref:AraC-like DNA-binding protein n=1 Tax=Arcicella rosea TaxID=502909 RepID=A0A841ESK3_9BACT|nr:helix-turn-helix domain-containing protein [Arcicella rosea]MBB6005284.1 AraC-like DNA-binding protein [Arcicella rosea]